MLPPDGPKSSEASRLQEAGNRDVPLRRLGKPAQFGKGLAAISICFLGASRPRERVSGLLEWDSVKA